MTFRTRLLLVSALSTSLAVVAVAFVIALVTRRAFEQRDRERSDAIAGQFRREFARRGAEVVEKLERIVRSDAIQNMLLDLAKPGADTVPDVEGARMLAAAHNLDFLEIARPDGALISSAQWPARFGLRSETVPAGGAWFLKRFIRRACGRAWRSAPPPHRRRAA
jgi:hypothetical protein